MKTNLTPLSRDLKRIEELKKKIKAKELLAYRLIGTLGYPSNAGTYHGLRARIADLQKELDRLEFDFGDAFMGIIDEWND